jgi:hypothetical protein
MIDQVEGSLELVVRISILRRPYERNGVGNRARSEDGSAQADVHGRRRGREAKAGWGESGGSEGDAALRGTAALLGRTSSLGPLSARSPVAVERERRRLLRLPGDGEKVFHGLIDFGKDKAVVNERTSCIMVARGGSVLRSCIWVIANVDSFTIVKMTPSRKRSTSGCPMRRRVYPNRNTWIYFSGLRMTILSFFTYGSDSHLFRELIGASFIFHP